MGRFSRTAHRTFDLLIVGGGVIGAGIARDAALRGLQVALFDKGDFGGGTTAGSTRLVHGGLRYLEMADFGLVRMDLREREILLRIAPHLVKPVQFLVPLFGRSAFYRFKLKLGMLLYDLLSFDKSLPGHRWLTREQLQEAEPALLREDLQGAVAYSDAQVELPERLCLENLIEAREHWACLFNYAEVTAALRKNGRIAGLCVRDVLSGDEAEVTGRVVVNATGPWFDRVSERLTGSVSKRVRTTKGVHLACPSVTRNALVLFSPLDGRLFFAIPWLGYTWAGTTDTDYRDEPRRASATADDVDYLMRSARSFLPTLGLDRIFFSNAGVRALVMDEGEESSVSREHSVVDETASGAPGLISVLGGKITGYRAIAEELTDLVCRRLRLPRRCRTAETTLPGARRLHDTPKAAPGLSQQTLDHLVSLYGSRAAEVADLVAADAALAEPLAPDVPDVAAQVVFAARAEQCLRVSDFLLRRTRLGFGRDQGCAALRRVAALLADELHWGRARHDAEIDDYLALVAQTQAFRGEGRDHRIPMERCRNEQSDSTEA